MQKSINARSGWQLFGDGPQAYEKYIVPAFSSDWAKDMVNRAGLQKGDRILDLGCGTGIVSRTAHKLLGETCQIIGVDVNAAAIKKAVEICPPNLNPIEYKQANAEALPFADASFDVVLCQQGLQYFPDRPSVLSEINRVLVTTGRTVFSVWRSLKYFPFYTAIHRALEMYLNKEAASQLEAAFSLSDPGRLKSLFKNACFKKINISLVIKQMRYFPLDEFLVGGFIASPFANEVASLGKQERQEMFRAITRSISDYIDDNGLAAPMECYIVSALK